MKQPENELEQMDIGSEIAPYFAVDIFSEEGGFERAELSRGRTKTAALKAAIRRLERLKKEAERMLEKEQRK